MFGVKSRLDYLAGFRENEHLREKNANKWVSQMTRYSDTLKL